MVSDVSVRMKRRALTIRREVEGLAAELWSPWAGIPAAQVWHSNVADRLTIACSRRSDLRQREIFAQVERVIAAYRECSDVIHCRSRALDFDETRADTWESDLGRLREMVDVGSQGDPARA